MNDNDPLGLAWPYLVLLVLGLGALIVTGLVRL